MITLDQARILIDTYNQLCISSRETVHTYRVDAGNDRVRYENLLLSGAELAGLRVALDDTTAAMGRELYAVARDIAPHWVTARQDVTTMPDFPWGDYPDDPQGEGFDDAWKDFATQREERVTDRDYALACIAVIEQRLTPELLARVPTPEPVPFEAHPDAPPDLADLPF